MPEQINIRAMLRPSCTIAGETPSGKKTTIHVIFDVAALISHIFVYARIHRDEEELVIQHIHRRRYKLMAK